MTKSWATTVAKLKCGHRTFIFLIRWHIIEQYLLVKTKTDFIYFIIIGSKKTIIEYGFADVTPKFGSPVTYEL
jgi:hypothetical protein